MMPARKLSASERKIVEGLLGPAGVPYHPLGPYTTYKAGGPATIFVEATGEGVLARVREVCSRLDLPLLVLGAGSNLLVADSGVDAVVVRLGPAFDYVRMPDGLGPSGAAEGEGAEEAFVEIGGAAMMPRVARRLAEAGWSGLAWAVGVPGSFGGAVRMNAGGHGSDTKATLVSATVWDLFTGEARLRSAESLALGYRTSALRDSEVVLSVVHRVARAERDALLKEVAEIVRWRLQNQPGGKNAGSVFVNPPGDHAARLIEEAGLKGLTIGSAKVSEKHANFIQLARGGRADDVYRLIQAVRDRVEKVFGVRLDLEVRLWGF